MGMPNALVLCQLAPELPPTSVLSCFMFCDPNIYYRTGKPMSRDIQWVQFYDICAAPVVAPGLISISEGAMSKVTTIRWCRGLPFHIELISRLMSWTTFVSDDGRLDHFQEAGLRSWKVPLPVLGIVPHTERAARKYGHASPIVARRKNLNPIDLISVILVE
jgi:hypothetical protein